MNLKIMNTFFLVMLASLSTLGSCTNTEDWLGDADVPAKSSSGAVYYLDSEAGDDSNDGLSPQTAWRSLGRIDNVYLQAGNSILLRRGSSWQGRLAPRGQGTRSAPIIIGAYGEGERPLINGCGEVDAAVKLSNQSYWTIQDLEVTNTAPARDVYRCGILVENDGGGTVSGIVIRNNKVHDVTSSFAYSGDYHPHQFGGISVTTKSVTVGEEKFDDVLIENNEVERVGRTGIVVWDFVWGSNTQSSTQVVVRGNTVRETDSDGILTYGCNGSLIEYNLADGCGAWREDGAFNGAAAIWCTRGKNCVIQFNEACRTKALEGNDDGTGFDIDLDSTDCIVQYNYSHDNAGGFMLLIDAHKEQGESGSRGSIVRYNISQNDRKRLFMVAGGVTPGMQIYNNTLYVGEGLDTKLMDHTWDNAGDLDAAWSFRNNLICNFGSGEWTVPGSSGQFVGNVYFGNHPASEPDEVGKMTFDPMLAAPGTGGDGRASLEGYKLSDGSPAIGAGVQVASNGGSDFWGNPVSRRGAATVGAFEPAGEVQIGGYLWDPIDNWDLMYYHSDNLDLDGSNPQYFDTDASRAVRQNKEDGVVIYRLDGLRSAKVTAYFGVWYGVTSTDVIRMEVSASGKEGEFVPVATRGGSAGDVAEGWQKFEIFVNELLPEGMNYLKVSMVDTFNEAWAIQLGEVEISDEPAEVVAPADNTFTDPLDNLDKLVFSAGSIISAWSPEEDIVKYFDGDAGRVARSDNNEALMAWHYPGVADFAITAFYCGDPGENFGFIEVLGTATADPATLTSIPVSVSLEAVRGDWREYRIRPLDGVPQGYDYLAVRLPQSPLVPGGWELQLGEVKISDALLGGAPELTAFTDPLDDMSHLAAKSDNVVTDWGNEANFDGDGARATRSSSDEGFIAYSCPGLRSFDIKAFFSVYIDTSYLKVYAASADDFSDRVEIPCTFTQVFEAPDAFLGYSVTPEGDIPECRYLYIELVRVPVEGNGWTTQIGSVTITAES